MAEKNISSLPNPEWAEDNLLLKQHHKAAVSMDWSMPKDEANFEIGKIDECRNNTMRLLLGCRSAANFPQSLFLL